MNNFGDSDFLSALDDYIDNPSVTGFFIEQAVLSYIGSHGLNISKGIYSPMETGVSPDSARALYRDYLT
jgi:hypothetical protein